MSCVESVVDPEVRGEAIAHVRPELLPRIVADQAKTDPRRAANGIYEASGGGKKVGRYEDDVGHQKTVVGVDLAPPDGGRDRIESCGSCS